MGVGVGACVRACVAAATLRLLLFFVCLFGILRVFMDLCLRLYSISFSCLSYVLTVEWGICISVIFLRLSFTGVLYFGSPINRVWYVCSPDVWAAYLITSE